jgi:hypothetical protein
VKHERQLHLIHEGRCARLGLLRAQGESKDVRPALGGLLEEERIKKTGVQLQVNEQGDCCPDHIDNWDTYMYGL